VKIARRIKGLRQKGGTDHPSMHPQQTSVGAIAEKALRYKRNQNGIQPAAENRKRRQQQQGVQPHGMDSHKKSFFYKISILNCSFATKSPRLKVLI
jgi:hypothetical protein